MYAVPSTLVISSNLIRRYTALDIRRVSTDTGPRRALRLASQVWFLSLSYMLGLSLIKLFQDIKRPFESRH
jgi:hypothetical protein